MGCVAIDIGNTRIAVGAIHAGQTRQVHRITHAELDRLGDLIEQAYEALTEPDAPVVMCSVAGSLTDKVEQIVDDRLALAAKVVGRDIPLPIETTLLEPDKAGVDRLVAATAAYDRGHKAVAVADFGSAITVDVVSDEGVFMGGVIMPGLRMQAQALASGTSALPQIELAVPDVVIGRNTGEAILSGVIHGTTGAVKHIVEQCAMQLGRWPELVLTGGDAELMGKVCNFHTSVVADLILYGLELAEFKSRLRPESN